MENDEIDEVGVSLLRNEARHRKPPLIKREREIQPTKKKFPIILVPIFFLLITFNIVVFGVKFIRNRQNFPDIHVAGIDLVHWILFLDIAFISFVFLFIFLRLFSLFFEKLARHSKFFESVYLFTHPYERAFSILIWAIILLFLEPVLLGILIDQSLKEELILDLCWSFLAVAIVNTFTLAIKQILESTVFEAVLVEKSESARNESLLTKLEAPAFKGKQLKEENGDFFSGSLRSINSSSKSRHSIEGPLKEAAQKIVQGYSSVRSFIREDDLQLFEKEKKQIMEVFDTDKDGIISEEDLMNAMRYIYKSRRLAFGKIKSRRLVVDVTNYLINVGTVVASIFTVLLIFDYDLAGVMISIGTGLIAISFAYSKTLQELGDSLYMFYWVQPFYVGDHIQVDSGPPLIVANIGMLSTFFYHIDGYGVYIRNSHLFRSKLCNLNVGDRISMEFEFLLNQKISAHIIAQINLRLGEVLKESKLWSKKFTMFVNGVGYDLPEEYLKLTVRGFVKKGTTWQDIIVWKAAKTEFILRFQKITEEFGITFEPSEQASKIQLVNEETVVPELISKTVPEEIPST